MMQFSSMSSAGSSMLRLEWSMSSNTTARPRCCISAGVAADGLMMAPAGARRPRRTPRPPRGGRAPPGGGVTVVAEGGDAALRRQRPIERADHLGVVVAGIGDVLAHAFAADRHGL